MRFLAFSITCIILLGITAPAKADPKMTYWSWYSDHWIDQDFKPYIDDPKHPHNTQWDNSDWIPEHWSKQRKDALTTIEGFYFANVLNRQYYEDGLAIVEVGPGFYKLSGQDVRRLMKLIDSTYEVTTSKENGMFMLYDGQSNDPIGSYTKYGLQLQ